MVDRIPLVGILLWCEGYPIGVFKRKYQHRGNIKEKQMEKKEAQQEQQEQETDCICSHKTKERSDKEYQDLMNRLKRIEGQVRGIQGMLQKDAYCADVLMQVAAVNAALNSFNKALLANHVRTCVADNIREGNDEVIDELVILLQKLMK